MLVLTAATIGCSAPTVPEINEVAGAERRVHRSIVVAGDAADDAGPFLTLVRHNPADCECPPWEIAIGARWARVAAIVDPAAGADATRWYADPEGAFETSVSFERDEVSSATGWNYPTVRLGVPRSSTDE